MSTLNGYLAFPGFLEDLHRELRFAGIKPKKMETLGNLILVEGYRRKPIWAANIWGEVERFKFDSVADATRKLKQLGLRWAVCPHLHHRRALHIGQGLTLPKFPALSFPEDPMPKRPLGSFMMISENEILASSHCSQTVPNGEIVFREDKVLPPTRAYLKLWEVFTRLGRMPKKGDFCLDLGSCPGGWTWVIAKLGAQVVSVDRTEIANEIKAMPGVEFRQGNAFTLNPALFERVDWVFSDVICEPRKLLELVERWLELHPQAVFICSVKFKGETDFKVMNSFLRISGSSMVHLNHNKHEVTWIRMPGHEKPDDLL